MQHISNCSTPHHPHDCICCLQYKTEELQRLLVAQPGKFYTLESCVSTTATYGDTFRVITRTRFAGGGAGSQYTMPQLMQFWGVRLVR